MPSIQDILSVPRDILKVRRVFGEPIEKNGITVVPVAMVVGGGGAGIGTDAGDGDGGKAGAFGTMARPVGVYVIRKDEVTWQHSLDITLLGVMGIVLAGVMTLVVGSAVKRHQKRSS